MSIGQLEVCLINIVAEPTTFLAKFAQGSHVEAKCDALPKHMLLFLQRIHAKSCAKFAGSRPCQGHIESDRTNYQRHPGS